MTARWDRACRPGVEREFSVTPPRYGVVMLIDCDCCVMKSTSACDDCVVSALVSLGEGLGPIEVDEAERAAMEVLAEAGLVPRLRLLPGRGDPPAAAAG